MNRLLFAILLLAAATSSCMMRYKKYDASWILVKYLIDGEDLMDDVMMYNFTIYTRLHSATPPMLHSFSLEEKRNAACDISFFKKSGQDYLEMKNHHFYSGVYEIKCLDKNCCTISVRNNRIYMEMDYDSDLPFGKSRKCPEPRIFMIPGVE
jgi:hypothetical protein